MVPVVGPTDTGRLGGTAPSTTALRPSPEGGFAHRPSGDSGRPVPDTTPTARVDVREDDDHGRKEE